MMITQVKPIIRLAWAVAFLPSRSSRNLDRELAAPESMNILPKMAPNRYRGSRVAACSPTLGMMVWLKLSMMGMMLVASTIRQATMTT